MPGGIVALKSMHAQLGVLNIGYFLNETNTDVCMYTLRIYSYIVEVVVRESTCYTSGYTLMNEVNIWNLHWFIYKHLNRHEKT